MSKELEAFENIMRIYGETNSLEGTYDDFLTIKKALQRLEAIDNAKPNDALKCLIGLEKEIIQRDGYITNFLKIKFDVIKQALIKAQEQEKVLKIIKEKSVDIFRFKKLDFNTFNQLQRSCKLPELTQEEFELLKRWIDNGLSNDES